MWWAVAIPGFILGGMSSLHCVGMCGPLVLALPVQALRGGHKVAGVLLYNAGRITSYTLLGIIAAFTGRQLFVPAWQHWLAIAAGICILTIVILQHVRGFRLRMRIAIRFNTALYTLIARNLRERGLVTLFVTGMANGLLPCGLVWIALTAAFTSGSVPGGVLFMACYGLGTVPLMAALAFFGITASLSLRNTFKKITPILAVMAGVLLLLRGFNVSVPFISYWLPAHNSPALCRPLN
jgi:sulfite exporter TauE/SafE